jgi:hypothetical protein
VYSWNNVGAISRHPQNLDRLPAWTTEQVLPNEIQESQRRLQAQLEETQSVESALRNSLNNPDIITRVFAAYGLGAIEDLSSLVEVLGNPRQFAQVRWAAITALRAWIGRDAKNDQRLFAILEKKYSAATAEVILHLLHGFSTAQLEKPEAYANLMGYLKHADLPVRELAHRQLLALVPKGQAIPYDPAGGRGQRDQANEEWRKVLPDGTVPRKK